MQEKWKTFILNFTYFLLILSFFFYLFLYVGILEIRNNPCLVVVESWY